ncbi:MAG: CPBP family intramembrane metalloprotease [Planctomycetaceae bacterium]|nr:CPBP family intramembrane metalloprotease [Planctomycetaceae bacterium]
MSDGPQTPRTLTVSQFLIGAGIFEGGMLLVAFALGWLVSVHPTQELLWTWQGAWMGVVATGPLLLFLAAGFLSRSGGLRQIREFLQEVLGPMLHGCRLIDILFLALLAGVCEEVLFRGLVYQWARDINPTFAIMLTNILFGLAHAITPMYAWLAGIMGLYLTALMTLPPEPNLLIPIVAHTLYDFIAFLIVRWDFRRQLAVKRAARAADSPSAPSPDSDETEPTRLSANNSANDGPVDGQSSDRSSD